MAVSLRLVLLLYLVVPLCALVWALDRLVFASAVRQNLPSSPHDLFAFHLLFGWPHIVASNLILFTNREYLARFKWRVAGATAAIAVVFGAGSLVLPYNALFMVVATATIWHVLMQQLGIARGISKPRGRAYGVWSACA